MNNSPHRLLPLMLLCLIAWTPPSPGHAQTDSNKNKIALVMKALSNPFFSKMEAGAKEYARENDVTLEVFGTEMETDIEHQISLINNLTSRGYGAIVIAPADSRKLVPPLKQAIDQGIVVINIDNPLDQHAQAQYGITIPFVGSDNAKGAALVGDYFRRKLHGKGRVIIIEGISGAQNGELRKAGFRRAITAGGGIEIVNSVSANWHTEDAFAHMSGLLEKQGAVDAVFCANDQMALGVLQALNSRDLSGKVLVGGYDNIEAAHNELRNGRMHATIEQHPELMGRHGVALALRALQGKQIPTHQEVPLDLITYESFGKRIALSLSDLSNPFFATLLAGARAQAKLHGVELRYADAHNDDGQQLLAIQDFVDKKMDFILINPTNSQAVQPGIEIANHAHIPVITVDRKEDGGKVISHITSDNMAGGRLAGEYVARQLERGGTLAEFEGIPGTSVSYERGKGFNDLIAQHAKLKVTAREVAHFNRDEARQTMARLLARQQTFDAVFAHNDSMILGVLDALQAADPARRPLLVGFDAIPEALRALREGRIDATVAQKPERMGNLAMGAAIKALRQETVPPLILVELDLIERGE
ncbi:MAG: substrate-binding domain-containing protein [Candidatus Competibacteraceae bacterium]|nr:MAG: substrate-binding domain-containing protein [Candidatus Competibacteraceae bacterium]